MIRIVSRRKDEWVNIYQEEGKKKKVPANMHNEERPRAKLVVKL